MRIGIDATAVPPKPMGAGRYIIYLIHELAKLKPSHEFIIFAQEYLAPYLSSLVSDGLHIEWVKDMSPQRRLIWEQTIFLRLIRQMGLDLLHSPHYTMPLFCPVPSVVTFHDMSFFIYPKKHTLPKRVFFPWMMRRSSDNAEIIITDSESTRRDAIRFLEISPEKIVTVHLGYQDIFRQILDQEILSDIRQKYKLPEKFIYYAGAIEPRKNVPLLLRVFENIVQEGFPHHLVLTGGLGWSYDEVLSQIDTMQCRDRVHRIGHVPSSDLPGFYNLAEVFVYPSVYEGFGLPPLEGMACGTPVITTNISAMPEFVGAAGILVSPNDERALFQAVKQVLEDDALRLRLQDAGPQQAASFTWKHTAEKTLEVYQKLFPA
jgi:glycosyltransferase involved in cell wall biosynthesis